MLTHYVSLYNPKRKHKYRNLYTSYILTDNIFEGTCRQFM